MIVDPIRSEWADVLADERASRLALICLGIWLNAADSLVSAAIMPSVARAASVWVFAAGIPLALGGLWAVLKLTSDPDRAR